ncbi:MAG: anthrone oxygenase family protein [Caulobacteraceae bacterium]
MAKPLGCLMFFLAWLATTAPIAHVLELPNKLAFDGPLWLTTQKRLYQGWGVIFGPVEIAALLSSVLITFLVRAERRRFIAMGIAALAYFGMLVAFFLMNAPVNDAVNRWIPADLPADWPRYRLQWESGHAVAAALSLIALVAIIGALRREKRA